MRFNNTFRICDKSEQFRMNHKHYYEIEFNVRHRCVEFGLFHFYEIGGLKAIPAYITYAKKPEWQTDNLKCLYLKEGDVVSIEQARKIWKFLIKEGFERL